MVVARARVAIARSASGGMMRSCEATRYQLGMDFQHAIPAPGNWVWAYGLIANFKPGRQETWVDYAQDRAPLLFIAGEKDHIMPPSVNRSNANHYKKSPALTEYHEFEGRDHWTCAAPGWEAVADYALSWAEQHASTRHRSRKAVG